MQKEIYTYLTPKYIYIPIDNNYQISKDYIYKLEEFKTDKEINYSSVSGYIKNITYKLNYNNQKIRCLIIENDYKQKIKYKKNYLLPNLDIKNNLLIINAYDIETYINQKSQILKNYIEEILETIDYLLTKHNLKQAIIILRNKDIKYINNYLGTYPNIITSTKYNPQSIEINKIYQYYLELKYQRPITTKIITIIIDNHKLNINVKIGCELREILKYFNLYKDIDKNYLLIVNSCINDSSISSDELIITKDISVLIFIKNNFSKTKECINCGKCINICPLNLLPSYIMKYNSNIKKLKKLQPQKCIECSLCSYICPSKIELKEHIKLAKSKVGL